MRSEKRRFTGGLSGYNNLSKVVSKRLRSNEKMSPAGYTFPERTDSKAITAEF
jgi:hypothetical protein